MQNIHITGSSDVYFIPSVDFNAETGICEIKGESFLEETEAFYRPLKEWLHKYIKEVRKPITFIFNLKYFNTSSSKAFLDVLKILKQYEEQNGKVTVNWHYDEEDLDMEESLEDYRIDTGLSITLIPYSSV